MSEQKEKTNYTIMIAEDDSSTRDLLRITLQNNDWELKICEDGDQAMAYLQNNTPDVAILDINMPGASGVDICSWIKETHVRHFVPVILLTASRTSRQKVLGLNCGADEYLTKPFRSSELIAHINAFLRIKKLTDELSRTREILSSKEKELVAIQLAGAAAHELGQPLTQMMLMCQMLPSIINNNEQLQETMCEIDNLCSLMRDILKKMLALDSYQTAEYCSGLSILQGLSEKER